MTLLFAHRGAHRVHPENTLPAFEAALREGCDGVELDVRVCRSGEVVVCHDPTLERVAGSPLEVARVPWSVLREVTFGGTRVPLLDEVLDLVLGADRQVNVEVKGFGPDRRRVAATVGAVLTRRAEAEREALLLSTFDPVILGALARSAPGVRRGFLFDEENTGRVRAALGERLFRHAGMHPHHALCTPARVERWHRAGRYVAAWTVNDPARGAELAAMGVDHVITDDVPALRASLG